jgi:hypothetical protein
MLFKHGFDRSHSKCILNTNNFKFVILVKFVPNLCTFLRI